MVLFKTDEEKRIEEERKLKEEEKHIWRKKGSMEKLDRFIRV